jgi:sensor c-di-GMP phosphodiesterase-like protein
MSPFSREEAAGGGWVALATVLVAVVPVLALLGLAYASAYEQLRAELRTLATLGLRNTELVLDQAVVDLNGLEGVIGAPCSPETVARLERVVYDSAVVREVGLFRPDLRIYCTNFGAAEVDPDPGVRARFPAEGLFVTLFRTQIMGERSVVVHRRRADGAGANAVLAPAEFRNDLLAEALGVEGGARLVVDGAVLGQTARMVEPGTPGYLDTVAESRRFPVRVEATRAVADARAAFLQRVPRFGLVGLGLGVAAATLFARAMRRRLSLEAELRTALARGELEVHYQPAMDLATGRCAGAEALVRWRHPKRGLVHPDLFIAMAEETRLVLPMTRWLLRQVRDDVLAHFRDRPDFHLGVNLVALHFQDEGERGIVSEVERLLRSERGPDPRGFVLDPSVFMLELTERQLVHDEGGVAGRVMQALRALGCTLAIDDFGTGQSGLAYLQRFRVDYLKVDKAFVDTIGTDSLSRPVLDAIIDLAHRLGLQLIAEGVEHAHQVAYLRERGVQLAQGYYFSPPLPLDRLVAFVAATQVS